MPSIDSLLVQIDASTELLRRELAKAGQGVETFAKQTNTKLTSIEQRFTKMGSSVRSALGTLGVGLSVGALTNFVAGSIQAADAIGETARAADFSVERFQRLQQVFSKAGVDAGTFDGAMRTLSTRLGQYMTTGTGAAAASIERLGLKQRIASGEIQNAEQLFDALVARLGSVRSASERAAIAASFFGREAGAKMQDAIGQGSGALAQAEKNITSIFSQETVTQADKLADAWERISTSIKRSAESGSISWAATMGGMLGVDELQPTRGDLLRRQVTNDTATIERVRGWQKEGIFSDSDAERIIARTEQSLKAARAELARFELEWGEGPFAAGAKSAAPTAASDGLQPFDVNAIRARQNELKPLPDFQGEIKRLKAGGQELSEPLKEFIDGLKRGAELTREMRTETERNRDRWREAQEAFQKGFIDKDTLERIWDDILKPIEDIPAKLEPIREATNAWAKELGQGLQSAFADWLVDGEFKFKEFLKRLAAEWLTAKIFKDIKALSDKNGDGSSVLGGIFGFREKGGPVMPGGAYIVGEQGPELFKPSSSGTIVTHEKTKEILRNVEGFAKGGRPPLGRVSIVGEKGPELFIPDRSTVNAVTIDSASEPKPERNAPSQNIATVVNVLTKQTESEKKLANVILAAPRFAAGGRPPVGRMSIVGERGPELFVPDAPGRVISNAQSAAAAKAAAPTVSQSFNIEAGLPPQWDAQLAIATRIAAQAAHDAIAGRLGGRR